MEFTDAQLMETATAVGDDLPITQAVVAAAGDMSDTPYKVRLPLALISAVAAIERELNALKSAARTQD